MTIKQEESCILKAKAGDITVLCFKNAWGGRAPSRNLTEDTIPILIVGSDEEGYPVGVSDIPGIGFYHPRERERYIEMTGGKKMFILYPWDVKVVKIIKKT